jgi:hypothetical protein
VIDSEPSTFDEDVKDKVWKDAMIEEYKSILKNDVWEVVPVIAQFVARSNGYKIEGQTGVTGTYPTQCHHDGEALSL